MRMSAHRIVRRGKLIWTVDLRHHGMGRFFGTDKRVMLRRIRSKLADRRDVEVTHEDRIAKWELGDRGTLLQAVYCFISYNEQG